MGTIQLRDLKPIWRIVLAVVVLQLFGSLVGLLLSPHHFWFMNLWIGGAIATPVGFVAGLCWQLADPRRRSATPVALTIFMGVLALWLGGAAIFFDLPQVREEMRRLDALKELDATGIRRISIHDRYGEERLATIEEPSAITAFAEALRDVRGYSPNHPRYISSWYLVIEGRATHELECHYESGRPTQVVGDFVTKYGNRTWYHGAFISQQLRGWFEDHVQGVPPRTRTRTKGGEAP